MNINSYDWNALYQKANEFIKRYISDAKVNTGCQTFANGNPRVEISFPMKGNKKKMELFREMKCIRILRGFNGKDGRMIRAEIIFSEDGTLDTEEGKT